MNLNFGGFNILTDELPGSEFVFSHPPYHSIIQYSGNMWGKEAHPDDLSHCPTYQDFIKKLDLANAKIYSSLINGGYHAILLVM